MEEHYKLIITIVIAAVGWTWGVAGYLNNRMVLRRLEALEEKTEKQERDISDLKTSHAACRAEISTQLQTLIAGVKRIENKIFNGGS